MSQIENGSVVRVRKEFVTKEQIGKLFLTPKDVEGVGVVFGPGNPSNVSTYDLKPEERNLALVDFPNHNLGWEIPYSWLELVAEG